MNTSTTIHPHHDKSGLTSRHEIAWQVRRIPMSYGRHCPGQTTLRARACTVPYESHLEREALVFLARCRGFRFIASQPFTIQFIEDGQRRRYTPDFLAVFDPVSRVLERLGFSHWTAIEIKPSERLVQEADAIRQRLQHVVRMTGFAAVCLTEQQIAAGGQPT